MNILATKRGWRVRPMWIYAAALATLFACGATVARVDAQPGAAKAAKISFNRDIEAIFQMHCAACHIDGIHMANLNLGSYQGLLKGGAVLKGAVIVPGKHAKSYLWQITQLKEPWPAENRMPLGGPYLSAKEEATITAWIDQGAKNN